MLDIHLGSFGLGAGIGFSLGLGLILRPIQRYRSKIRQTELTRQDLNKTLTDNLGARMEGYNEGWEKGHSGAPKYEVVK